jgi:hypothetical protein
LENASAAEIQLEEQDVNLINDLAAEADVGGTRYPEELLETLFADSLPLDKWSGRKL